MDIISYLVESSVCMGMFYVFYALMLHRGTFFSLNRFVIILMIGVSFVIPFLEFNISSTPIYPVNQEIVNNIGDSIVIYSDNQNIASDTFDFSNLIFLIFPAISLILLARFLTGLIRIRRTIKQSKPELVSGRVIYLSADETSPFTFINKIVLPGSVFHSDNLQTLIKHESAHARGLHNIDIIAIELIKIFFWFNPFLWLFSRRIREVHEFIADRFATENHTKNKYIDTMLSLTFSAQNTGLANNWNGIKLIKRLKMLTKPKSPLISIVRYFLIIPVFTLLIFLFACEKGEKFRSFSHSSYGKVDEMPKIYPEYQKFGSMIKERLNLPESWKNKTAKYMLSYEVTKEGKLWNPIITAVKIADEPGWKHYSIDSEVEDQIIRIMKEIYPKFEPALKNGKPVKHYNGMALIVGDPEIWYRHNLGSTVLQGKGKGSLAGLKVPYEEAKESGKTGISLLSKKQVRYILNNMNYPDEAEKNKVSGKVELSFLINSKGRPDDVIVEEALGYGCDEEAVRIIKSLKGFKPNQKYKGRERIKLTLEFMYRYEDTLNS